MARALRVWEGSLYQDWSLLSPAELNEAYARLEERYNCLRSNWEWFVKADYAPDRMGSILSRVEQN